MTVPFILTVSNREAGSRESGPQFQKKRVS